MNVIDVTKPLELSDGTPVEFVETQTWFDGTSAVKVRLLGNSELCGTLFCLDTWNYDLHTGVFIGDNKDLPRYAILRNRKGQ